MKPEDFVSQLAFSVVINEDGGLILFFGFKDGCNFIPEGFYSKN